MPAPGQSSSDSPTLFCLHFLGGSANEWKPMIRFLPQAWRCVTVDLPGFGNAFHLEGYSVQEMADRVAGVIGEHASARWMLAGHSMGAKVAAVLARRAENGEPGLSGLSRLVLLAGSPPGPEPIPDEQREAMLGWFRGEPEQHRGEAQGYIDGNIGAGLEFALNEQAVGDVLRINPAAWLAWLEGGSREDWSVRVGVLGTPTLLVAGEHDAALGAGAQCSLVAPHFARVRLVTLPGAGHLLPLERAEAVARLIEAHAGPVEVLEAAAPEIGEAYRALIDSDRISARTRALLLDRARPDDPGYVPSCMSVEQLAVLRAAIDRVLPQPAAARIDLAARIDRLLASGTGDGWRFALLPPDAEAYRAGLGTLEREARKAHGRHFVALDACEQDALLERAAAGALGGTVEPAAEPGLLDAPQMRLWFEDLRAEAVKAYVAHPATLARMGYGGIGYGGDTPRKSGFGRIGAGEREAWEPVAATAPLS